MRTCTPVQEEVETRHRHRKAPSALLAPIGKHPESGHALNLALPSPTTLTGLLAEATAPDSIGPREHFSMLLD